MFSKLNGNDSVILRRNHWVKWLDFKGKNDHFPHLFRCKSRSKWQEKSHNTIGSWLDQALAEELSWVLSTEGGCGGRAHGDLCLGLDVLLREQEGTRPVRDRWYNLDFRLRKHGQLGLLARFLGRNSHFASKFASVFVASSLGKYQLLLLPFVRKDRLGLMAVLGQGRAGQQLLGAQHWLTSSLEEGKGRELRRTSPS